MSHALIRPTDEEDKQITEAALSDVDAFPLTDIEWKKVKKMIKRARPKASVTKNRTTIQLSQDVLESFRSTGNGWQTHIDNALKDWLKNHSS